MLVVSIQFLNYLLMGSLASVCVRVIAVLQTSIY